MRAGQSCRNFTRRECYYTLSTGNPVISSITHPNPVIPNSDVDGSSNYSRPTT